MCDALISFLLNCLLLTRIEMKEAGALGAVRVVGVGSEQRSTMWVSLVLLIFEGLGKSYSQLEARISAGTSSAVTGWIGHLIQWGFRCSSSTY